MNGRVYDQHIGQFIQPDNNVQYPNYSNSNDRYSYCLNNPVNFTDPSGEFLWWLIPLGIEVVYTAYQTWSNTYDYGTQAGINTLLYSFQGFVEGTVSGAFFGADKLLNRINKQNNFDIGWISGSEDTPLIPDVGSYIWEGFPFVAGAAKGISEANSLSQWYQNANMYNKVDATAVTGNVPTTEMQTVFNLPQSYWFGNNPYYPEEGNPAVKDNSAELVVNGILTLSVVKDIWNLGVWGVKVGWEGIAGKAGGEVGKQFTYTFTESASRHISEVELSGKFAGLLKRPYMNSPSLIQEIMSAGKGVPDATFKGGMNWKVPGTFRGSQGTWELGINPKTKVIYHFQFKGVSK